MVGLVQTWARVPHLAFEDSLSPHRPGPAARFGSAALRRKRGRRCASGRSQASLVLIRFQYEIAQHVNWMGTPKFDESLINFYPNH